MQARDENTLTHEQEARLRGACLDMYKPDLLARGMALLDTYAIARKELDDSAMSVLVELNFTNDQAS